MSPIKLCLISRQHKNLCGLAILLIWGRLFVASAVGEVSKQVEGGTVSVDPATLKISYQRESLGALELSSAILDLGKVLELTTSADSASWKLTDKKVTVTIVWKERGVLVHLLAEKAGAFTFPQVRGSEGLKGWILPLFEGVYAPAGDSGWNSFLTESGELNTTADFGLPFFATDHGDRTVTYIFTNQFNNRVRFESLGKNQLAVSVTHDFTRNHPLKEYAVLIEIGKGSPVEPAKLYRQWLQERGEFISLGEKIKKTPDAAKLLGAIHAYVWGDGLIASSDITDWKRFARELSAEEATIKPSPAKRIWDLLRPETQKTVKTLAQAEWADNYTKSLIVEELNRLLVKEDFYNQAAWTGVVVEKTNQDLIEKPPEKWSRAELCRLNSALFAAAFPEVVASPETWGNGVCPKMVGLLAAAGIDRLCFLTANWDGLVNRPETVESAKRAGYLIGTYDSYDSVHPPKLVDTWETAQFDQKLYETGAIINADGSKRRGFQKKGFRLSPGAARPYMEKRVTSLMDDFHANAWFMDCDGFGDFFDDYSTAHPATQQSDMEGRIRRMAWIRDTFGAVMGTEGCSAGVAATVHFAHGVMTPVIGWGDADLKDKKSPYYLGSYYPPDEPQVFFKPVLMKGKYRHIYFDPRYRLPLFETVFHDSVVATHHWSFGSLKIKEQTKKVELLELLYQIPPLYHLNIAEFKKRKTAIQHHYEFFSPLHRQTGLLPMTDFRWLTADHAVQLSSFGGEVELLANFSTNEYRWEKVTVQAGSIAAKWSKTGDIKLFTP